MPPRLLMRNLGLACIAESQILIAPMQGATKCSGASISGVRNSLEECRVHNDRVVIVTGGAGGIGSKIVDRFVRNGDQVIAIDRDVNALKHLQESCKAYL
jgi:cell division GTPase FtsZ